MFLNSKIKFLEIAEYIEKANSVMKIKDNPSLSDVIAASENARDAVYSFAG